MDEYNLLIDEDNLSDYIDEPDEESYFGFK